jgi:hypothetical protein
MDWTNAIETNRQALSIVVANLAATVGQVAGRLPQPIYRMVLMVLLPAESALRRLIVIASRSLKVVAVPSRPMPNGTVFARTGNSNGESRPTPFRLYDTRKSFDDSTERRSHTGPMPRIGFIDADPPFAPMFLPRAEIKAAQEQVAAESVQRVRRRIASLKRALETLPRQALRMARWRARQSARENPKFTSPLRPGAPPGHREKPLIYVDFVLRECHALAREALQHNTS